MNCAITALALFAVLLPALGVTVPPPKGLPAGSKGPDISVRRVTVDPANPMTGQSFRVEVSISNDGDWPSSLGNCRIEIMNSNGLVVAMSEIVHADVGPKNMEQYGRSFSLKQPGEYIARATWYTELPDFKGLQDKSETSFTCSGTDISGVKQNPFDLDGSLARQEAERKLSEQQQAAEASRQVQLPQQPQQQLVQQAELARQERARQQQAEQAKQEQAKREQVRQQQLEQERQTSFANNKNRRNTTGKSASHEKRKPSVSVRKKHGNKKRNASVSWQHKPRVNVKTSFAWSKLEKNRQSETAVMPNKRNNNVVSMPSGLPTLRRSAERKKLCWSATVRSRNGFGKRWRRETQRSKDVLQKRSAHEPHTYNSSRR